MEYKSYSYKPYEDHEPDNIKIFHDVEKDGKTITMDWSPYRTPSFEDFKLWIDLGCPARIGCGPLDRADLDKINANKCRVCGKEGPTRIGGTCTRLCEKESA